MSIRLPPILPAPMKDRALHMRLPVFPRALACLLAASLVACGSAPPGTAPAAPDTAAATTPAPPIKIGIALGGGTGLTTPLST